CGHMGGEPDGPLGGCGQRGCLEALCGGASIERRTGLSAEQLFDRAAGGDEEAAATVRRAARAMGDALVTLTHLFDPDVIIFGGGIAANSWTMIQPMLAGVLDASPFIKADRRPELRLAMLGQSTGRVGAAAGARIEA